MADRGTSEAQRTLGKKLAEQIGPRLRQARQVVGISRAEAGLYIDLTDSAIGQWETGKHLPSISYLLQLCEFYKADVCEIIGFEHHNDSSPISEQLASAYAAGYEAAPDANGALIAQRNDVLAALGLNPPEELNSNGN